jgi:hypothetical protein
MICESLHQALITHAIYVPLITKFGNFVASERFLWSDLVAVAVTGLAAFLVQSFFALRIWRLSNHNVWLAAFLFMLIAGAFTCTVAFTFMSLRLPAYYGPPQLKVISFMVTSTTAACDILITAALCTLLHKSRGGFRRCDILINKMILFAVTTGCFTSLCAVGSIIGNAISEAYVDVLFYLCLGRCE